MIRLQSGDRNRVGTAIAAFGVGWLVDGFVHHSQVVEGVGEVRVKGAEARLLLQGSLAQEPFRGRVVAGGCGLFRRIDGGSNVARFRHGLLVAGRQRALAIHLPWIIVEQAGESGAARIITPALNA